MRAFVGNGVVRRGGEISTFFSNTFNGIRSIGGYAANRASDHAPTWVELEMGAKTRKKPQ